MYADDEVAVRPGEMRADVELLLHALDELAAALRLDAAEELCTFRQDGGPERCGTEYCRRCHARAVLKKWGLE